MKHMTFALALLAACAATAAADAPGSRLSLTIGSAGLLRHRLPFDPGVALFAFDAAAGVRPAGMLVQVGLGVRTGKKSLSDVHIDLLAHKVFGTGFEPYLGGGIGVHHMEMDPGFWPGPVEDNGISLVASGGLSLWRGRQFSLVGDVKGYAIMSRRFGAPLLGGSAGIGVATEPGGMGIPMPCMWGAVGAFIATGLFLAFTN